MTHNTSLSPFRMGVESILPGAEDWFATIYGCWYGKYFTEEHLAMALREVGADFTLFYDSLAPKKPDACRRITDMCRRMGIPFLFNNTYGDIQGPWVEGYGRAEYTPEQLRNAAASGQFLGVVWDEVEHRQLHAYDTGNKPYFLDMRGLGVEDGYEQLTAAVHDVLERYSHEGVANVGEYVFPSMMHLFARAGMIPAPKVLKDSFNPVMLAIGMGAARQYGLECWAVLDLWGIDMFWGSRAVCAGEGGNPGHSPDEYLSALKLCYWLGLDAVYTEALYNFIVPITTTPEEWAEIAANPIAHRGVNNPLVVDYRKKGYILTAYGKLHRWFKQVYLPEHPRSYTFRDIKPETAIICLPDSTWASRAGVEWWCSQHALFGPGGPAKEARHEALLDAFHLLTHGVTPRTGLSFHNEPFASRRREILTHHGAITGAHDYPNDDQHTGFCPLNGVIVYDHRVGEELLRDIPLLICTGETLSVETAEAVHACVRRGAKCLALPHLFSDLCAGRKLAAPREMVEGQGRFLLTDDFTHAAVHAFIAPHLGPTNAIRYRFGQQQVQLCPLDGDERRLSVTLEQR